MSLLSRLLNRKAALASTLQDSPAAAPLPAPPADAPAPGVETLMARANEQFSQGNLDQARECYKAVLSADPGFARAYYMLSGIAAHDGDMASAIGLARRALALQPAAADVHFSLGTLYASSDLASEAIASYQEALRLKPDQGDWHVELASALTRAGRLDESIATCRARLRAAPADARMHFELGYALQKAGRYRDAEQAFLQCVQLAPDQAGAQVNLAMARRDQGRPVEAERPARRAVELAPDMPEAWFVLGNVLTKQARHAEAVEPYRRALALKPDYDAAWSGLLFSMNYSEQFSAREVFDAHAKWGERFAPAAPMAIPASHRSPGHRIRVGYLSADYRQHPVAHFLEPILQHHDRARFQVLCYHTGPHDDAVTARLKGLAGAWRRLPRASDEELERALRADQLDILVELSGHSEGHRLPVLARRQAPIQVTYLGYPNTTGLRAIDYRLTDALADPPGAPDALYVERLVRLPDGFLCYSPPAVGSSTRVPPSQRDGHITFGSFNNLAKIGPTCVGLWARILAAAPGSRLLLKSVGLQDPGLRAMLLDHLVKAGVDPARVALAAPLPDHQAHMQTYDRVDIALDTFPYHGTTTTLDALWMNVPVITLAGDRHAARVGVSLLRGAGVPELVAATEDEYVSIAAGLAADRDRLAQYGEGLRRRLASSPLTDGRRFTAGLERAYSSMFEAA